MANKKPVISKKIESTGLTSDLDRIQTYNLLSRNQVRYSVAPRGLISDANIEFYYVFTKLFFIF